MDFGGHSSGRVNKLITFVHRCGVVRAHNVDREAISRSVEENRLADNIKPDRMLRGERTSEREIHNSHSTSKLRDRS